MSEWRELKTLREIAEAQVAGEEIECSPNTAVHKWDTWDGSFWLGTTKYRSRPRKSAMVVLREALFCNDVGEYSIKICGDFHKEGVPFGFVKWLDTPARTVIVEL